MPRRFRKIVLIGAAAVLTAFPATPALAGEILRVVGDENFPPYEFVDENQAFKGFNVDLMKAVGLFADLEFKSTPLPWEEAYAAIENGSADIIQGMKVTESRKQHFAFSDTLVQSADSIYIKAGNPAIHAFSDLAGKRVGVDYGDMRDGELEKLKGATVVSYQNPELALLALYDGEVDALVCNTLVVSYLCNKYGIAGEINVVGSAFNQQNYAIAVSRDNPQLLEQLNAGIKAVQDSGAYDQLYRKWFGVPIASRGENMLLAAWIMVGALVLIIAIILAYDRVNRRLKRIIAEETAKQRAALEKLQEYDKLQFMDRIISSLAHEIRNPLASIRFYAEQIPHKMGNPRFMAAVAEDIPPEIERIDALIKEFIEYTSPRKPDREHIRLRDALEHALSFLHVQLQDIRVELEAEDCAEVFFDRNHLRQILLNVLINSIDALDGREEPRIWIAADTKPGQVELVIRDNGGGAGEETMKHIFAPFYTTKKSGNGLGMFVVRRMAEENGGSVSAENENGGMAIRLSAIGR